LPAEFIPVATAKIQIEDQPRSRLKTSPAQEQIQIQVQTSPAQVIMASTPRAGKRKILDLQQRVQVLKLLDQGQSCRVVAQTMSCGKTQIQGIKGMREEILKEWEAGARPTQKFIKRRKGNYDDLNDKTLEWFLRARAKHLPLSGPLIQVIMVSE
jgi:hypothetical protein